MLLWYWGWQLPIKTSFSLVGFVDSCFVELALKCPWRWTPTKTCVQRCFGSTFLRHCAYTHLVIVTALQCKLQLLNIASQVSQMPRAPAPERGMHALTMGENGSSCSSEWVERSERMQALSTLRGRKCFTKNQTLTMRGSNVLYKPCHYLHYLHPPPHHRHHNHGH